MKSGGVSTLRLNWDNIAFYFPSLLELCEDERWKKQERACGKQIRREERAEEIMLHRACRALPEEQQQLAPKTRRAPRRLFVYPSGSKHGTSSRNTVYTLSANYGKVHFIRAMLDILIKCLSKYGCSWKILISRVLEISCSALLMNILPQVWILHCQIFIKDMTLYEMK